MHTTHASASTSPPPHSTQYNMTAKPSCANGHPSYPPPLPHSPSDTHSHSPTLTHTHTLPRSLILTITPIPSCTCTPTHTFIRTRTLTLTQPSLPPPPPQEGHSPPISFILAAAQRPGGLPKYPVLRLSPLSRSRLHSPPLLLSLLTPLFFLLRLSPPFTLLIFYHSHFPNPPLSFYTVFY